MIGVYINISSNEHGYVNPETDLRANVTDLREANLDGIASAAVLKPSGEPSTWCPLERLLE